MRSKPAPQQWEPIVLAVVTHLPTLEGYHAQRLEVVKRCLRSMREGANLRHTFVVWDNGSCDELREWLHLFGPDVLIESGNIGVTSAKMAIFHMLPGGTTVAYSDDDILYQPGWLAPQIKLLTHFPNVAAVTGYPVRTSQRWGNENTLRWAREHAKLEVGRFIPQEWEDQFALSVGRLPEAHRQYSLRDVDYRVTYKGVKAYCTAHHCQMVAYTDVLTRLHRHNTEAMAEERSFDVALDTIGLRLATIDRWARHMGNVIDPSLTYDLSIVEPETVSIQ